MDTVTALIAEPFFDEVWMEKRAHHTSPAPETREAGIFAGIRVTFTYRAAPARKTRRLVPLPCAHVTAGDDASLISSPRSGSPQRVSMVCRTLVAELHDGREVGSRW
jgi:hypothetical protein